LIKSMKNGSKYLFALSLVALLSACGSDDNEGPNNIIVGGSELVSATIVDDIDAATVLKYVQGGIDENATNAFAYKAVKISYNTVGQDGKALLASGLLVIPTATEAYKQYREATGQAPFSVSMLCDNHGTIFTNDEAPTLVEKSNGAPDYALATLMTGYAGFAGIFPDYIGYGDSNSVAHPYMLKKASARSSLDMINSFQSENYSLSDFFSQKA